MGLSFLDGRSYWQITRDERFFCQHLYSLVVQNGILEFVSHLNDKHNADLDAGGNWEAAYETCFYRDLWHYRGKVGEPYSPKRTFDLALFSDQAIVVIEAKAQQAFEEDQLEVFEQDKEQIVKETGVERVLLSALASSKYKPNTQVQAYFNGPFLTWREVARLFGEDQILLRADDVFETCATGAWGTNNLGGHMTGAWLLAAHRNGEDFFIGRRWGLHGEPLNQDLETGRWRSHKYETNRIAGVPPNANWFRLSEFVRRIDETQ